MHAHALKEIIDMAPQHWWYRVRRRIIKDLLEAYAPAEEGKPELLDVGSGAGDMIADLQDAYSVRGVEGAEAAVVAARGRGLRITKASLPDIPFEKESFDVVTMLDVLEHIENDRMMVEEIFRVLRPGGTCIVFVPAFMSLWGVTDVSSKHFRRYTRATLLPLLQQQGFSIARSTYFNTFLFLPIAMLRLSVRALSIPMKTEAGLHLGILNDLLYAIFRAEAFLLKFINFPFGVSFLCVCRKPQ